MRILRLAHYFTTTGLLYRFSLILGFLGFLGFSGFSGVGGRSSGLAAQQAPSAQNFPRVRGQDVYLSLLKTTGDMSWQDMFNLSLEASGVERRDFAKYQQMVSASIQELRQLTANMRSYEKGEAILSYMFRSLRRYEALQTRVDVMLDTSTYNCVSSALYYIVLARALDLQATGVGTFEHAFVNLELGDGRHVDVETTNRYGFDPGSKKEFIDQFTAETGFAYVPKRNYSRRADMRDVDFVGLILQNRLYILNQRGVNERTLEQMIPLAADLATLTQADADIKNFFEMSADYMFRMSKRGALQHAFAFSDLLLETYGTVPRVLEVRDTVAYNDIVTTIQQANGAQEAQELLAQYTQVGYLSEAHSRELAQKLATDQFVAVLNDPNASFERKRQTLEEAERSGTLAPARREEMYFVLYNNEASSLQRLREYQKALQVLSQYPGDLRSSTRYRTLYSNVERNYAADFYNQAVAFFNQRNYSEAERIIQQGLLVLPNNSLLQQAQSNLNIAKAAVN